MIQLIAVIVEDNGELVTICVTRRNLFGKFLEAGSVSEKAVAPSFSFISSRSKNIKFYIRRILSDCVNSINRGSSWTRKPLVKRTAAWRRDSSNARFVLLTRALTACEETSTDVEIASRVNLERQQLRINAEEAEMRSRSQDQTEFALAQRNREVSRRSHDAIKMAYDDKITVPGTNVTS